MSSPAAAESEDQYLYGIVLATAELPSGLQGVQGHPVRLLESGRVAAVVSDAEPEKVLGTPDNLLAHTRLLDALAAETPVLPLAFGTVVPGAEAVTADVLEPGEEEYHAGLEDVSGRVQYTVAVTFDRDTVMREIVQAVPEVAELRTAIAGTSEDQTRPQRIRLGELMVQAFEEKQPAAAEPVLERLERVTVRMAVQEQRQPEDVVQAAVLVAEADTEVFEEELEDLGAAFHPRLKFRLVGPQAPYDFVPEV